MFKVCIEPSTHPDTGIVAVADTIDALRFPASPPQEHVTGSQWWTDYQPVSYTITSKRGNRDQFAKCVSYVLYFTELGALTTNHSPLEA